MRDLHLSQHEREALAELKIRLGELLGDNLQRMVLFGSKARGDAQPESDLDVAVLVRDLTRERKRQIIDLVIDFELERLVEISVLAFSIEEFDHLKSRERRIALDIESEGIPL